MEPTESAGMWWLPETPEAKVPGVLKIDERGSANLELIGCFKDMFAAPTSAGKPTPLTSSALAKAGNYGRICGQSGTDAYTLDSCHRGRLSSALFNGIASEEVRVGRVYKGLWLDRDESASFDQADVRLQWLPFWLMESAIDENWTWEGEGSARTHKMQINVKGLASRSCRPWKGWTVSLNHSAGLRGDSVTGRSVSQEYYFTARTTQPEQVERLLNVLSDVQTLVAFGVNRTVGIERMTLRHPDVHPPDRPQRRYRTPIDFVVPWSYRDTDTAKRLTDHDMAFTFPQIGGMAGVRKFLHAATKHRSSLTRVIASSMAKDMFVSDQLLHRAASLEAFDRVRTNTRKKKIDFKDRLKSSVAYVGSPFTTLVRDTEKWATRITKERNDAAHTLGLGSDAADQYFLARSLYWLYVLSILREANTPKAAFVHIGRNPEFEYVAERLTAMGY
ncbi:MAG TPA: HEPN domain-containing protein [Mycobacteriales bacterium]|nr:HEPN domain-containing protein [Mycobacteriales bacterium]